MKERKWYERNHSFKLTKKDIQLYRHLQNSKNKSKTIRDMLLVALSVTEGIPQSDDRKSGTTDEFVAVLDELNNLKKIVELNHKNILKELEEVNIEVSDKTKKQKSAEKSDVTESEVDSAKAMFESFGMDF